MHILILGGGGMVGRKLSERLARDGNTHAGRRLLGLLYEGDDLEALQNSDDPEASEYCIALHVQRGDLDALRTLATHGDARAGLRLADLLAARGDTNALRDLADSGEPAAAGALIALLVEQHDAQGLAAEVELGTTGAAALYLRLTQKDELPDRPGPARRPLADPASTGDEPDAD